ncbi:MAG: hypothetical protein ACN4F7_06765, partial [Candidatus Puniceispirillaceae bacterium]
MCLISNLTNHLVIQNLRDGLNHIQMFVVVLFLLGDLFDFWFEYKTVVPNGFVRLLGNLAYLSDQ